jgi:hypothetical protein
MTGDTLKTQFENLIGDTLDETFTFQLMTQAKNKVEVDLKLEILKAVDQSLISTAGDTYLSMKTLPTAVRQVLKMVIGYIPYYPVGFLHREQFRFSARRYYIDWKNRQFALCGTQGSTQTIKLFYIAKTDDLTAANKATDGIITWPDEFQPLIPYEMASIYQANIDPDEIAFRMSPEQEKQMQRIKDSMIAWDHDIKLASMGNAGGFADDVEGEQGLLDDTINLGMM